MDQMKNFVASEVPLEGSNLIEASAGTGKTYSIAILLLRLLLEKQLAIKEVLMVTFQLRILQFCSWSIKQQKIKVRAM
jgi:exodeoxyribonuclease V beta subunit